MTRRTTIMGLTAAALCVWNGAAKASEGMEAEPAPALVTLNPLLVPIVEHGALLGRLEVRAMWRLTDGQAEGAEQRLPQLRAALVEGAAEHARLVAAPGQAVDPAALADRLQQAAKRQGFSGELLVLEAVTRAG